MSNEFYNAGRYIDKVIEFDNKVDDLENYAEKGMRARVLDYTIFDRADDPRDVVIKVTVDFSEFDDYNKQFETANYYDKHGVPNRTAREAGYYEPVDTLYMPAVTLWDNYFKLVKSTTVESIRETYNELEDPEQSYVEWLEQRVLSLS